MKMIITNTMTELYKEKTFHFLPFLQWQKIPSWADLYEYRLRFGWLCWNITIVLKDEGNDVEIKPLEEQQ